MTTDIYIKSFGTSKDMTSYSLLGIGQSAIPVLRGKKIAESGSRSGIKKYWVDNGASKRLLIYANVFLPFDQITGETILSPSLLKPVRMTLTMRTPEDEAEGVLALCGLVRAFGGDEVSIDLRKEYGGNWFEISDVVDEYGTMGLNCFGLGGGYGG